MGNRKFLVIFLLLLVAGGAGAIFFLTRPTVDSVFAEADAAEKDARAKLTTAAKPEDVHPFFKKTVELYRKVAVFGKNDKHAESLYRIGKIQQDDLKDEEAALKTFDELASQYPTDETRSGDGLLRAAGILRKQGQALAEPAQRAEARKKLEEALARLEAYRKAFPAGKRADESLMTTGNTQMDDLQDPPARAVKPYQQLCKDFPRSEFKPEAMYRIGQLLERMDQDEEALEVYRQLSEEYPSDPWARKGELARGKLLRDIGREEEAIEELRRLAEQNPGTEEGDAARDMADKAAESAAGKEASASARGRYGSIPVDTGYGAPPWKELKQFADQKLDAKNYVMTVDFLPEENRISVAGTLEIINAGDEKNRQLLFMLSGAFQLKRISLDGVSVATTDVEQKGDMLRIPVATPIKTGQSFTLAFEYTGQYAAPVPDRGGPPGSDHPVDSPEDIKKAAREAMKGAATRGKSGPPMNLQIALGKDGYALSGAFWYPITVLGDLFDAKITYHVPAGLHVAATGAEIATPRSGGKPGEFVFATRRPVFGLYFAYGDYVVREQNVGPVTYITYLKEPNASKSAAYVETAARILNFYGDKFMTFPYEKMAIVETPLPPILGGVGPSSMMMLSARMVAQPKPPEWLLAHELAHQWFGNLVPINIADEGYSQWLSEGFATYCDALYTEQREGRPAFVEQIRRYTNTYMQTTRLFRKIPAVRTCIQASPLYRPVVYEKGALVLHALRKVMGDQKFFVLMKRYVETYADKTSVVHDFEKLAEEVHGKPLDWFFKQWLDEPSFARWEIRDVACAPGKDGKEFTITIKIEQPADLIRMPVDVTLLGDGTRRKVIENVEIKDKDHTFVFPCEFKPAKVILDEDNWTLHSLGAGSTWPREAKPATRPSRRGARSTTRPATSTAPVVETAPASK